MASLLTLFETARPHMLTRRESDLLLLYLPAGRKGYGGCGQKTAYIQFLLMWKCSLLLRQPGAVTLFLQVPPIAPDRPYVHDTRHEKLHDGQHEQACVSCPSIALPVTTGRICAGSALNHPYFHDSPPPLLPWPESAIAYLAAKSEATLRAERGDADCMTRETKRGARPGTGWKRMAITRPTAA